MAFCANCEKHLQHLEAECPVCRTRQTLFPAPPKVYTKTYEGQEEAGERRKGTKIKEQCPECGSEYMYYYAMQLRSADEGQTVFYECDCGYKTKLNT